MSQETEPTFRKYPRPENAKLLSCPFCGFTPEIDEADCIYPSTRPHFDKETNEFFYPVWELNCYETGGGCGAEMMGDSPIDVINKWNTRT